MDADELVAAVRTRARLANASRIQSTAAGQSEIGEGWTFKPE